MLSGYKTYLAGAGLIGLRHAIAKGADDPTPPATPPAAAPAVL